MSSFQPSFEQNSCSYTRDVACFSSRTITKVFIAALNLAVGTFIAEIRILALMVGKARSDIQHCCTILAPEMHLGTHEREAVCLYHVVVTIIPRLGICALVAVICIT